MTMSKSASGGVELFKRKKPVVDIRGAHLDLKGVPPTSERLLSLLDTFAAARFNAVLVEWEDMFPWTVDTRFRCETAYTPEEVRAFAAKAKRQGIELIPLVQCLGHMETPLKFPEYAGMREVPNQSDVLNPLAPGAGELIRKMIDDVLALLPETRLFHLGGDEAWSFGTHPDTRAYIEKHGKGALYMKHVEPLLDHLAAQGMRPILWHDMMIEWDDASLDNLGRKADLCVWGYGESPLTTKHHFSVKHIERFKEHGVAMWGGTAYKGADGSDSELPNVPRRLENVDAWTQVAARYGMRGVFATAWSRYSTMNVQTEPIDAALDSLMLTGATLYNGKIPKDAAATGEAMLRECGEWERFAACRGVMAELASQKSMGWENARLIRLNLAEATIDPSRCDKTTVRKFMSYLKGHIGKMEKIAGEIAGAFKGLIPALWLERYTAERILPLKEAMKELEPRVGTPPPEAHPM